jgi:hypothetical protein
MWGGVWGVGVLCMCVGVGVEGRWRRGSCGACTDVHTSSHSSFSVLLPPIHTPTNHDIPHCTPNTNAPQVGRHVNQVVAGRFGKAILELGGNNALIVDASADLDMAVRAVLFGSVRRSGGVGWGWAGCLLSTFA